MISAPGFSYQFNPDACAACGGRCCRGLSGYVWISMAELEQMAAAQRMTAACFARRYLRQTQGRLSLQERIINGEHFCCFFDRIERRCAIYEHRPEQCRTFPFWEKFRENDQNALPECPGAVRIE